MSTRVLLMDEHEITRQGVRSRCEKEGDIEVVAEAANGRTAVALVSKSKYNGQRDKRRF